MSATTSGALKAVIESLGLSIAAHRDEAPTRKSGETTQRPYVTISEGIVVTREPHGDQGDANAHRAVTELVQVDLWEDWRGPTGALVEDPDLAHGLVAGVDGAALPTAPHRVYSCTVDDTQRFVEVDANTVHTAITVRIRRDL